MTARSALLAALLLMARGTNGQTIIVHDAPVLYTDAIPFTISGTIDAPAGTPVRIVIGEVAIQTTVGEAGEWRAVWTAPLETGAHDIRIEAAGESVTHPLRVQLRGILPRQSGIARTPRYAEIRPVTEPSLEEVTDRWRIVPPPYELDEQPRAGRIGARGATLDPYNRNLLKGDYPIRGNDTFLVLTGISDTLAESRTVPVPSGVSTARPGSFRFFGSEDQNFFLQNLILSADLYQGDTTFQPARQRVKATVIANLNHLRVDETAVVKPDVRRGTRRTDGFLALQELFYERKLRDLTPNYDFLSVRAGVQPFVSDFRGFVFSDTNLGVRLFGNYASNRYQYNLAYFERLEKDTNSGLNIIHERRGQRVVVANFYWQDFIRRGYTQQFSIHHMRDDASTHYDRNGVLVRPAPAGAAAPHDIHATYVGAAGLGHFGRINVDHAVYFVFGRDSLNPIAGPDPLLRRGDSVSIAAGMAALELSYDRDWLRPRIGFFYATGDHNPRDRTARGFDSIFDTALFAGGGFSFFNRLGIRLASTGVALVERGSLLPSLRSSKDEGQPNYVNPGIQLATIGLDVEVTPRLKAIFTGNYIRLDATESVEALLFQKIRKELGTDLSAGVRYRPFISNNWIVVGGLAAFIPGRGFRDIYESGDPLYHLFTNVILQF
ncbi:MAG TPA: hypothetical protein VMT00_02410 [Thermoanaerobaculia bacterium]|nr:hypothetical protein [Thermoanaerobaculia bacterium]